RRWRSPPPTRASPSPADTSHLSLSPPGRGQGEGRMTMSLIKVRDLAWARMRAPDLDAMEEFLTHFGLTRAARTPTALYMRGTDPLHHIHVTEKADGAGFVGFAYHAASEADLARLAGGPGPSAVESVDEPGGGKRVRLREPNGYQVEVIWGLE